MKESRQELIIQGMVLEKETEAPIVILKEKGGERVLPVWIGPFEASAIIIEMQQVKPPRPMTHDLLADMFHRHGFRMTELLIHRSFNRKYLASLSYRNWRRRFTVDIRPSDGLAMAARLKAPVFATEEVFQQQSREPDFFHGWSAPPPDFLFLNSVETAPGAGRVH